MERKSLFHIGFKPKKAFDLDFLGVLGALVALKRLNFHGP